MDPDPPAEHFLSTERGENAATRTTFEHDRLIPESAPQE